MVMRPKLQRQTDPDKGSARPNGRPQRAQLACAPSENEGAEAPSQIKLRAELLAAATTTVGKNLAATNGRLAGEEAVAAGTHEVARLESALHLEYLGLVE